MAKTPDEIANLIVWLDADAITSLSDGNAVATWADQSGEGNDAVQDSASYRPTYETNELNGKPVVRFSESDEDCLNIAAFESGDVTQPYTLFIVCKDNSLAGSNYLIDGAASDERCAIYFVDDGTRKFNITCGTFNNGYSTTDDQAFHYYTFVVAGSSSDAYEDGVSKQTGVNYGTQSLGGLTVGAPYTEWPNNFDGDIAEIILYDSELSSSDIGEIEDYLVAKWFSTGTEVTATLGTLALAGYDPTVTTGLNITAALDTLAIASYSVNINAETVVAITGGGDGLWDLGAYIYPDSGSSAALTVSGYDATVETTTEVNAGAGTLAIAALDASVTAATAFTATADALTLAGYDPAVAAAVAVSPGAGALSLAGYDPSLNIATLVDTQAAGIAVAGYNADVNINATVAATAGQLAVAGANPTISTDISSTATTGALTVAGYAAAVNAETSTTATAGALTIAG